MTAPLTLADIARMVADAYEHDSHICIKQGCSAQLAAHVRALAAELNRRDLVHVNEVIELQRAVDGRGETIDALEDECAHLQLRSERDSALRYQRVAEDELTPLRAQLEAVTREREEIRAEWEKLVADVSGCEKPPHLIVAERDRYKAALENINRISGPNVARDVVREALKGAGE